MAPKDIIVVGTKEYKQQVMADLQKLTNQKLIFKTGANGQGKIEFAGTPTGSKKPVGTDLVSKLIASKHETIIKASSDGDNHTSYTDRAAAEGREKGGSGATVEYNPNNRGDGESGIKNADGTTGRPPQVGLGHELGHVEQGIDGKVTSTKVIATNPDDNNARTYLGQDEIDVRKNVDNPIRKEQGAKQRALPVVE
ncbi:M91 family zinc metallopeptidase [Flavobacterium pectinovorum]|nr:M91 family zinc metallopeptidase [Flavobacterium pectinovorum]